MKPLLALLALCPVLALGEDQENPIVGKLRLANGDHLSGQPSGFNEDGDLIWKSDALGQPLPAKLDRVLEMRLQGGLDREVPVGHQANITLTNGDTIRGELSALDDEFVTVNTWYADQLKIRRSMARDLEISRSEQAVFTGPEDIAGWTIDGEADSWSLQRGVLASSKAAGIAREVPLPDKCRVSIDLAWRSSLRLRILLFSDDGETSQPDNCYDLVCQRRFVYLRKRWRTRRTGGSRIIGQVNVAEFTTKEKVNLELYFDRKAGVVGLFVDGRKAETWTDPNPDDGDFGNWMHFVAEDFYPVQVSHIEISPWRGELPESTESEEEQEATEEEGQLIRLQNGDFVVGEVGKIVDGVLAIKTKYCDMKIPVGRMRSVDLSTGEYEEPKRMNGDVRAWLKEGGSLTFRLDSFDANRLTGFSQTFGEAQFDLNAFSRVEFNIHEEDLEPLRTRR